MRTLFVNPPSFEKFDGGASARYQATREITSFWYPVWLAYPAGLVKDSRLLDGPAQEITLMMRSLSRRIMSSSFSIPARPAFRATSGWPSKSKRATPRRRSPSSAHT